MIFLTRTKINAIRNGSRINWSCGETLCDSSSDNSASSSAIIGRRREEEKRRSNDVEKKRRREREKKRRGEKKEKRKEEENNLRNLQLAHGSLRFGRHFMHRTLHTHKTLLPMQHMMYDEGQLITSTRCKHHPTQ